MRIEAVSALGDHAAAWDSMVDAGDPPSPFLRSWWLDHAGVGEPLILLAFDGGPTGAALVGGLALQRDRVAGVERVAMLGTSPLGPDHLDVVAAAGRHEEVATVSMEWLRDGDRLLDLQGVAERSVLRHVVREVVDTGTAVVPMALAPYVRLTPTLDEYLATRRGQTRSTISRVGKRLAKAGVVDDVVAHGAPEELVTAALDDLHRLHDGRWGDDSAFLACWDMFTAAMSAGVDAGDVVFHRLVHPDIGTIAIEADLLTGGRTSFYQAGRLTDHEWRGSGSVLKAKVIGAAIEAGHHEYDLLRGDEPYKQEWATAKRPLFRITAGTGIRSKVLERAARANRRVQAWRQLQRSSVSDR